MTEPSTPAAGTTPPAAAPTLAGTVVETMDSGGYTYVLLDTGEGNVWAAGPQTPMAVGDVVSVETPMEMPGFHSNTLERDFEMIYFASGLTRTETGTGTGTETSDDDSTTSPETNEAPTPLVEKAPGGQTVGQLFSERDELTGTEVVVRGEVVKFTPDIMGKNWLHLQDGSGSKGTNDLTVTTFATVAVGDVVLIRGVLERDKDFGAGYVYELIVENAEVTVE